MPRLVKIKWNRGGHFEHIECIPKRLNDKRQQYAAKAFTVEPAAESIDCVKNKQRLNKRNDNYQLNRIQQETTL